MPWRNQGHLCLLYPRCHRLCTMAGFTSGFLGSAVPSSFAINGAINAYCCLLIWRAASACFAPVCW